ncbi:HAD family hydrolase [candidate division WOR-3 bacterium]|nr:HAD family hydrolase [candidate division WOR-3 bacterium]
MFRRRSAQPANPRRLKAVLLDIDNTVILFDESSFYNRYIDLLAPVLADVFDRSEVGRRVMCATRSLEYGRQLHPVGRRFMDAFCEGLPDRRAEIETRFDRFYRERFTELRHLVTPVPLAYRTILAVRRHRLLLAVASNPVWPAAAQAMRLGWAGLGNLPFVHLTHSGNSRFTKPDPRYYRALCDRLGVEAGQCLMVGNDPVNDGDATRIGMHTYLTTDSEKAGTANLVISRAAQTRDALVVHTPDFRGPLVDLPAAVARLVGADRDPEPARLTDPTPAPEPATVV